MAKKYKLINGDGEQARFTDSDIELLISVVNREARHWADLKAQVDRERYPTTGQLVVESAASWAALLAKLEEID